MNMILLGVAVFLLSIRRTILIDQKNCLVHLSKRSLFRRRDLKLGFDEVAILKLGTDMVYSGFAVAGSIVGQSSFPSPSLRLILTGGETVLLERAGRTRIKDLADRLGPMLGKPVTTMEEVDRES